jgi:two-component system cell cycle sensor histidine kinase/response regulator CckA
VKRLLRELRILIVEDSVTDAELMVRELKRSQIWFTSLRVERQEEFERAFDQFDPDVILSDYSLPAFDGITALRMAHQRLPHVPFLFVSGSIGEERAVEALRHGASDYIMKDRLQRLGPAVLRAMEEVTAREERKRADAAVVYRMRFEECVAAISTDFIRRSPEEIDGGIQQALARIGEFTHADRAYVSRFSPDRSTISKTHEWTAEGVSSERARLQDLPLTRFPWFAERLDSREPILIPRVSDLPRRAAPEKELLEAQQAKSLVTVPLFHAESIDGFLELHSVQTERGWFDDDISLLRIAGEIINTAALRADFEDKLRRSESMLSSAQRQAHLGSFEFDVKTGQVTWSDEIFRIFGFEPQSFIPTLQSVIDSVHPADREVITRSVKDPHGADRDYECRILRPDGTTRIIRGSWETLGDEQGMGVRIVGSALDVTEIREAAVTIDRLNRQNRLILESAAEGIIGIDSNGLVTFINPAALKILGRKADELIGSHLHTTAHHTRPDGSSYPWTDCPTYLAVHRGLTVSREEVFWRKDGSSVPVDYTSNPMSDESGNRLGAVLTLRDIEERKMLERQLEQANRLSSLGRLAATMAHEFNNVLMGIQPFNDVIAKLEPSDPKIHKASEQIGKSIQRGKSITQQILRYTRPATPQMQRIDLEEWLAGFLTEMRGVVPDRIALNLSLSDKRLAVLGDPHQLLQVLSNLVLNARDAVGDHGTISIAADRLSGKTLFSFGVVPASEQFVHLCVGDTGRGMTEETMNRIFEPFFTTKPHGTGLGLAVTHQIIQQHGGHIFVESEIGRGTSFHVFLPAVRTN